MKFNKLKILFLIVLLSLFVCFITLYNFRSKELKAMLNSAIANMNIKSAQEVTRSYDDKRIITLTGKPVYAYLRIIYIPKSGYSKEDVFNEIVHVLEENDWKVERRTYWDNNNSLSLTASLPYESFSLKARVDYEQNDNTIRVALDQ